MKRTIPAAIAMAAAATLVLTACGSGGGGTGETSGTGPSTSASAEPTFDTPITLTMAAWSLASTPEFQALADGFHTKYPNLTIKLVEYDAANYDTQLTADLAAGTAPDIFVHKSLKTFPTYQSAGMALDVSDVAASLDPATANVDKYTVDGKTWAVPYRQDAWLLFYNKDLFDKAKVTYPDGSWTWDDYVTAAESLQKGLKAAGSDAYAAYQHVWPTSDWGLAAGQTPGADILSGDFQFLKPYYERSLKLQSEGAQIDFGTATTNSLTYQAQFGTQKAAMMNIGSWYIAALATQQAKGDADTFNWGVAPVPQYDTSTTGLDKVPVSFADPTGLSINAKVDKDKVDAAKAFLTFAAGEDGAKAVAGIGITPALINDAVSDVFFSAKGVPTDDLSKFAWSTRDVHVENPVDTRTAAIVNILSDMHSAIMSGSSSVDDAISQAQDRAKSEANAG